MTIRALKKTTLIGEGISMSIRQSDFLTAIETSVLPGTGSVTGDSSLVTLGYANDNYTPREDVYGGVADITALKAIAAADRANQQIVWVSGSSCFYEFDSASSATPDDDLVVQPTAGTGRWEKKALGGGSTSGTASSVEQLQQKLDIERMRIYSQDLDNSKGLSGSFKPFQKSYEGTLMSNAASGASSVSIGWNVTYPASGDPNMDSTTGWSAVDAAASITATGSAGEFDCGASGLKFDKANTAVTAEIRQDRGAQNLSLASNTRSWFAFKFPSITNLTNVFVKVYADSTSNFAQYNLTTQYDGSALSTGSFNKFVVDFSTAVPSATGGTSFDYTTQMARYIGYGLTTSASGQTYTGVIVDSAFFSAKNPQDIGVIANEFTFHDNSVSSNLTFSSSNTRSDGPLTITGTTPAALTGGASGTARTRIKRSSATIESDMVAFDTDSTLSGAVTTSQNFRIGKILRESLSGSYGVFANVYTPQIYKVTSVSGAVIGLEDASASTANLVSSDNMHVFQKYSIDGDEYFAHRGDMSLSANSSASAGTTSVTGSGSVTGSIIVGDYVAKDHIAMAFSSVAATANESFSSVTEDANPNGIRLISNNFSYPNESNVWGHFPLGDISQAEAIRNRKGVGSGLAVSGTLNTNDTAPLGRFSSSGYSSGNFMFIPDAIAQQIQGDVSLVQISIWCYLGAFTGSSRYIVSKDNAAGNGYYLKAHASTNTLRVGINSSDVITTGSFVPNAINHIHLVLNDGGVNYVWLNGVVSGGTNSTAISNTSANFRIGTSGSADFLTSAKAFDMIIYLQGSALNSSQVNYFYNSGFYRDTFKFSNVEYRYTINGQTGQKVTSRGTLARTTTAVAPFVKKSGWIKTA